MFMWMYDLPHLPHLPCSNSEPMALCMNMWMNDIAFNKEMKTNPNLNMWKAIKQANMWNRDSNLYTYKKRNKIEG